uniref:outer membrane protein assembly factor BamB family protein n=1 Tax=Enterobacter hormaechei TaxID=158836 RepID=UPI0013DF8955
ISGDERWRFATGGDVQSSPETADGVVYVGSDDGNLYAIDAATGAERWRFATGSNVGSSPVVESNAVYVVNESGVLYALGVTTGSELFRWVGSGAVSGLAVAAGLVYLGDDSRLVALDAQSGAERWRSETEDESISIPATANGLVF